MNRRAWNRYGHRLYHELMASGDNIYGSASSKVVLVTGGYDYTIKLWQAHSGVCVRTMQHPESQVNALEITPDKQLVAAGGFQHVRMYDLTTTNPDPVTTFDGITKNIARIGFQEDGKWMYTAGEDCTVKIWDLRSRQMQCQRIFQVEHPVTGIFLHPNQVEIAIADQGGLVHMWDLRTDSSQPHVPEPEAANQDVAIDPTGKLMAVVNNLGNLFLWSLGDGEASDPVPLKQIRAHNKYVLRCKFSPDGKMLATTSGDGSAKLWSTDDWSLIRELKLSTQRWVWDTAFSADSNHIFTCSSDQYARLWNVHSGAIEREYCSHQKSITAMAFRDEIV